MCLQAEERRENDGLRALKTASNGAWALSTPANCRGETANATASAILQSAPLGSAGGLFSSRHFINAVSAVSFQLVASGPRIERAHLSKQWPPPKLQPRSVSSNSNSPSRSGSPSPSPSVTLHLKLTHALNWFWLTFCCESRYRGSMRARRSSGPARPYIIRLSAFRRLICPSVWPLLQSSVTAFLTASMSLCSVRAKRCIA